MDARKVIGFGKNSHVVSIPKSWARKNLLKKGDIVGWFQGKMEFGARALGNRSILANPTLSDMKDKINKYVKFREEFRPFAPAVIEEDANKYFYINLSVYLNLYILDYFQ